MSETRNERRTRLRLLRRERIRAGLEQPTSHGMEGYAQGCQCEKCTRANRERHREVRRKLASKDPSEIPHGLSGYCNYSCRCDVCRAAGKIMNAASTSPVKPGAKAKYARSIQQQTRLTAHRLNQQWTGPELELAARRDITARQLAVMIGRTYAAVAVMRRRLNREPMLDHVAGVVYQTEGTPR